MLDLQKNLFVKNLFVFIFFIAVKRNYPTYQDNSNVFKCFAKMAMKISVKIRQLTSCTSYFPLLLACTYLIANETEFLWRDNSSRLRILRSSKSSLSPTGRHKAQKKSRFFYFFDKTSWWSCSMTLKSCITASHYTHGVQSDYFLSWH